MTAAHGSDEEQKLFAELTAVADARKADVAPAQPTAPTFEREIPAARPKAKPAAVEEAPAPDIFDADEEPPAPAEVQKARAEPEAG